jgi:hypothetical protein
MRGMCVPQLAPAQLWLTRIQRELLSSFLP